MFEQITQKLEIFLPTSTGYHSALVYPMSRSLMQSGVRMHEVGRLFTQLMDLRYLRHDNWKISNLRISLEMMMKEVNQA